MSEENAELNKQTTKSQMTNQEKQSLAQPILEENEKIPENQNPQIESSDNNIQNNPLIPENQISDLIRNFQNFPPEINPQQNQEQSHDIQNMHQIPNIQGAEITQQQFNEQYMLQYQNQLPQMTNNPELPRNHYLYNYPQVPLEQNQYQQFHH